MEEKVVRGSVIYFLTELAGCTAQVMGDRTGCSEDLENAVIYLAKGNTDLLTYFKDKTDAVLFDASGLKDYDTEDYDGKMEDILKAIAELKILARMADTPTSTSELLNRAASFISDFYGITEETPMTA